MAQRCLELAVFLAQLTRLIRFAHQAVELLETDRLGQEFARAELHCLDGRLDCRLAGQHDDFTFGIARLQLLQHVEARESGHIEIEHHHVKCPAFG